MVSCFQRAPHLTHTMSKRELVEKPKVTCGEGANEVTRVDTVYAFTNFGCTFHLMVENFGRAVGTSLYPFQECWYKALEDFVQVTETQVSSSNKRFDPELKVNLEYARLNNGITSIGSGPEDTKKKLVFEVRQTHLKFNDSNHELPAPSIGCCFLVMGNQYEMFPGPKFPMSHLIYGVGSEVSASSCHHVCDTMKVDLHAEFLNPSWFRQESHHRNVLPGMALSEFLALSLRVSGAYKSNEKPPQPFYISHLKVDVQEFISVSRNGLISNDVRHITILDSEAHHLVPLESEFLVPPDLLKCSLPQFGPSFFSDDLLRSYGLKILVTLSRGCLPHIVLSNFLEVNLARTRTEVIDYKDSFNYERYIGGSPSIFPFYVTKYSSDDRTLQKFLSFAKDSLFDTENQFIRCQLRCYPHNEDNKVLLFALEGLDFVFRRRHRYDRGPYRLFRPRRPWHRLRGWKKLQGCLEPHVVVRLSSKAEHGDRPFLKKNQVFGCLMLGEQTLETLEVFPGRLWNRASPGRSYLIGESKLPLFVRINDRVNGCLGRVWNLSAVTTAGANVSAFMELEMIIAQGDEEANCPRALKDVCIQLEHIMIELIEVSSMQGRNSLKNRSLLQKDLNPAIKPFCRSDFTDRTPGDLGSCSMILPDEILDCKIPGDVEPYLFCPMSQNMRSCGLFGRVLFSINGTKDFYWWYMDLRIAIETEEVKSCFDVKRWQDETHFCLD